MSNDELEELDVVADMEESKVEFGQERSKVFGRNLISADDRVKRVKYVQTQVEMDRKHFRSLKPGALKIDYVLSMDGSNIFHMLSP